MEVDVLFFAEDPGAANYIVHLLKACIDKDISSQAVCAGKATDLFNQQNIDFLPSNIFSSASQIFDTVKPKLVVIGTSENSESMGLFVVEEAKRRKTPSIGTVDASMNAAYRFRGDTSNPFTYITEWLVVPDEWTKPRRGYFMNMLHTVLKSVCEYVK